MLMCLWCPSFISMFITSALFFILLVGAQITNRIKSQAKKTNAPMRAGKVLTWEVQPLSAVETPESVGTGTGPAGRLTLRLKQEGGQSTEEPAGMEVELEDSESEETEDEESEIQVEIKDEDEEAIVYVDDVSDVDYTPGEYSMGFTYTVMHNSRVGADFFADG